MTVAAVTVAAVAAVEEDQEADAVDTKTDRQETRGGRQEGDAALTRSGQALVELMVGLVALVVLIAGIIQVAGLTRIQTDSLVEARREVANKLFLDSPVSALPEYIDDIDVGQDGKSYSSDDARSSGDQSLFKNTIASKAAGTASEWNIMDALPTSPFSQLNNAPAPVTAFGLLHGDAEATVDTIPAVRSLLYDADQINVKCDVWMTWTRGIY
jgi:hypothetical protein